MMGSPAYMSPEHFLDFRRTDERADIYSLGKILFEAIEGKASPETIPFRKAGLSKAETPFFQKLDRIIQDATAEEREGRLPTVEQLKGLLAGEIDGPLKDQVPAVLQTLPKSSVLPWKKWSLAAFVAAVLLVASVTALNLHPLQADRAEHQESVQMTNESLRFYYGEQPSPSPIPSGTNRPAPSGQGFKEGNQSGYDDCEVAPVQKNR
jgi:serine/threonine protein kinase